ncbi:MAG: cobamide remodeling phosphodiesterase CbiR [Pseudomonadota bacterium]
MNPETAVRGRFDFRVAAPSFLIPADWATNARAVGHLVDEIELLVLESREESLPAPEVVATLGEIAEGCGVTYNIHLPTDLGPGHPDRGIRQHAVRALNRAVDRLAPLTPTTYTLHLPFAAHDRQPASVRAWQGRINDFLGALLDASKGHLGPQLLTVENIDTPPSWVWDAVSGRGVGYCFDVGHAMVRGEAVGEIFDRFKARIPLLHIHGVAQERDHQALTACDPRRRRQLVDVLSGFGGTAVIEVFNREAFWASVDWLQSAFPRLSR